MLLTILMLKNLKIFTQALLEDLTNVLEDFLITIKKYISYQFRKTMKKALKGIFEKEALISKFDIN